MQPPVLHKLLDQHLWLNAQRSIFWEEEKALIVSDLHFGKTGHFRKHGIAVPQNVYKEDLQRLVDLLHYFTPRKLLVAGDFFHSHANTEVDWFRKWRRDFSGLDITLVKGNHDILQDQWYAGTGIDVVEGQLQIGSFIFTHDRCEPGSGGFTFCGHIHPGVVINGLGKQSLRLPCFYFAQTHCILPAFSRFTGCVALDTSGADAVFAIADKQLVRVA